MVVIAWVSYQGTKQANPVTGEVQHVALSTDQEIALGLQAAPEMAAQYGGVIQNGQAAENVQIVGNNLVRTSVAANSPYEFQFHLLQDPETVNAFALPGGQIFITYGLYKRLQSEGQLAGVLGHEIGHVLERHGAEHMAKQRFTQGLTAAATVATYDPSNPRSAAGAAMAQMVGNLVNLKYGRNDELESDRWGIDLLVGAGYDPRGMVGVMRVLEEAMGGGGRQPEFISSHPNPGNRAKILEELIREKFPNGVPSNLIR